jgi:hypothetical protein
MRSISRHRRWCPPDAVRHVIYILMAALVLGVLSPGCAPFDKEDPGPEDQAAEEEITATASASVTVATANYSQNDPGWACDQLGACPNTTMGTCGGSTQAGCAVTAVTDFLVSKGSNVNPGELNAWLKNNGGFADGCLIRWSVAADYDGPSGLTWIGTSSLSSSNALKEALDAGRLTVAKSSRFTQHWVAIAGYDGHGTQWSDFFYHDPWDATTRRIGENGWVKSSAKTRVFE